MLIDLLVGVELVPLDDGSTKIVHLEEGAPAADSGLLPGDVVVNVDGTDSKGLSADEVALLLRGKADTKASVRVQRRPVDATSGGRGELLDFTIVRRPFKLREVAFSVEKVRGKRVGVISAKSFSQNTRAQVTQAMEAFHTQGSQVDSIVLDLRNNGGGLLQGGVETAALFLPPGKVVVFVVDKTGREAAEMVLPQSVISTDSELPDLRTPLYILVNSNTASAAEVLAAALKENGRATLVGEQTFGKGVIQTLSALRGGAGVAVTIAQYETPLHNNINKKGIPVDKALPDCKPLDAASVCVEPLL